MHKATKENARYKTHKGKSGYQGNFVPEKRREKEKKQTLAKVDQTPSHALVYDVGVVHHFREYRIFRLVSCSSRLVVRINLLRRGKIRGDWPGPRFPGNVTEDKYHVSDCTRLREGGVLRCKSTVPSESVAVSAVHGA
jgi:hypothetical protein